MRNLLFAMIGGVFLMAMAPATASAETFEAPAVETCSSACVSAIGMVETGRRFAMGRRGAYFGATVSCDTPRVISAAAIGRRHAMGARRYYA